MNTINVPHTRLRGLKFLLAGVLFLFAPVMAFCAPSSSSSESPFHFEVETVRLDPETVLATGIPRSGEGPLLVIRFFPADGYYTYANKPGGNAFPTTVKPFSKASEAEEDAKGVSYQIYYPEGQWKDDVFEPGVKVQTYEGIFSVFLILTGPTTAESLSLDISMLACSAKNCFPVKKTLDVNLAALPETSLPRPDLNALLTASVMGEEGVMPVRGGQTSEALLPAGAAAKTSVFGNSESPESKDALWRSDEVKTSVFAPAGPEWNFAPVAFQASLEVQGMGKALLFGLLAGLILNIMPCVLPVLTLKVSALLAAGGDEQERIRNFREHNLLFSAGIMTWFAALALLFGLAGMAWGQLFQNSGVVFAMMLIVFALGLAMFDVFHLPVLDLRAGANSTPRVQAYSTGLLATLLATPCSGPLLGGVLGWSLMQSLPVLFTVFLATGLGMSLPYLLMAWKPAFANRLPRAGAWMLTFERILGFFLMGTVIYLISILPAGMMLSALITLLATAIAAWAWGKWGSLHGGWLRKTLVGGGGLLLVLLTLWSAFAPSRVAEIHWLTWDKQTFSEVLGQKPLVVEFTADWCPTCKVLERTVLTPENMAVLATEYNVTLFKVDMTRENADNQTFLRALDSASIPLLAIFPTGEEAKAPILLRDLYSTAQMKEAVNRAFR